MVEAAFKSWHYQLKHTQLHEHWVDQIVAGSWLTAFQALTVDCLRGSSCYSRIIGDSNISWTLLCHRNPTLYQVISVIFIPLCNIRIIFAVLCLESVISFRVYLYHIVFDKEVACLLTIQGSYTRGEFKHTGLTVQLELQSAVDVVCLLNSHGKGKVVTFHTLKAYRGNRGTAPPILNLHC